jgi:hypothetical protein
MCPLNLPVEPWDTYVEVRRAAAAALDEQKLPEDERICRRMLEIGRTEKARRAQEAADEAVVALTAGMSDDRLRALYAVLRRRRSPLLPHPRHLIALRRLIEAPDDHSRYDVNSRDARKATSRPGWGADGQAGGAAAGLAAQRSAVLHAARDIDCARQRRKKPRAPVHGAAAP